MNPAPPAPPTPALPARRMSGRGLALALFVMAAAVITANAVFARSDLARALRAENRYTELPAVYAALPHDPDVVFLGDSRTILDPTDFERELERALGRKLSVFNLAMPGGPPIAHLAMTGHLLARPRPPELVVIFLSEFMFGTGLDPVLSRESIPSSWRAADAPGAVLAGMPVEDALVGLMTDAFAALRLRRGVLRVALEGGEPHPAEDLGRQGFRPAARVSAQDQRGRADGRAAGYRKELSRPARVNEEQLGYFDATLSRLRAHGIRVIVTTSPASTPLWPNYDLPLYHESFDRARALAAAHGVPFVDYRETAVIPDAYFADGDHMNPEGARRFAVLFARNVVVPILTATPPPAPPGPGARWFPPSPAPGCEVVFDFEELAPPDGWTFRGDAFREPFVTGARGTQQEVGGYGGLQLLNTHSAWTGDEATGTATSPPFALSRPALALAVGGGRGEDVRVELVLEPSPDAAEEVVRTARGDDREQLVPVRWDVAPWRGRTARLRVVDAARGAWAHVMVDDVQRCD